MKNGALFFATVFVSLLLAEGAMRAAGFVPRELVPNRFFVDGVKTTWSEPDSELGWLNRPGTSISIEQGAAEMTFWSHGRRATRPSDSPRPDSAAVMVVGGSNAQSYGVSDEDSFPYRLGVAFPDLWIENFGNGGYGTVQTLLLTRRMLETFYTADKPRLIIATFADSHIARNVSEQSWVYSISDSEGRFVSPPHFRLKGDGLAFVPFRTIGLWPLESRSALVTTLHHVWLQSVAFATESEGVAVSRLVFDQLAALARSVGSTFVVVVLEDYRGVSEILFENASFPVLKCNGYEISAPEDYLLGGGSHPNARYHEHFADCIGNWLQANFVSQQTSASP